uniref:Putative ATPase domain containing protein n=1 Tax=viral metagenome TaxID=1070528 RepID=A0A6M3KPT8_9ZZZZ
MEIRFTPKFVKTKNVRNTEVFMDGLDLGRGEGRFAMIWSESGRGKTHTVEWWHAHNESIFLRTKKVWGSSEVEFLTDLAKEPPLRIVDPPRRKARIFADILDRMIANPVPVFIDEIERFPNSFVEILRDLTNLSTAPVILVGEEELVTYMQRNRRVWTRTYRQLEFQPITASDVIVYTAETTGLKLTPSVADIIQKARTKEITDGNFRLVKRTLLALVQYCNAKQTADVTEEMARIAVKQGLSGA